LAALLDEIVFKLSIVLEKGSLFSTQNKIQVLLIQLKTSLKALGVALVEHRYNQESMQILMQLVKV